MCYNPIRLKSGEVVPCGHCEECYSMRRNEWSVRLQLHTMSYAAMPLFITLTYDDEHLPDTGVNKKDVQDFIKRIRDKFSLYNTNFSYFACGEYGDLLARPHYHILLFGMPYYETFALRDEWNELNDFIKIDWKNGNVFACRADWSGIHYVTKYVLKYLDKDWIENQNRPFTLCSKGIGKDFENSTQFVYIKKCVNVDTYRSVLENCPELDRSDLSSLLRTSNRILHVLTPFVESAKITLPSGKCVPLPRYFRKKLFGSYEHWKLNPFSYFRYVQRMNRYAKDMLNGVNTARSRNIIKHQAFVKKGFARGHLVNPKNTFNL